MIRQTHSGPATAGKKTSPPNALLFLLWGCAVLLFLSARPSPAAEGQHPEAPKWAILAGYGSSHPGWGETETRVETVDLVLRRENVVIGDMGKSWYRGYHSLLVELPVHFLLDYDPPMVGLNFLAKYTFTSSSYRPYLFIGGGPVYVDADIPGMGADLNGNYQIGTGLRFPLADGHELLLEARYHHISNGGSENPNEPLNSAKFLLGYTF